MKENILYVGNYLKGPQHNPSYMFTLGPLLEKEGYKLRYTSSKASKVLRLLDMLWKVYKSRHWADYVLVDTYSTQNFYYAVLVGQLCHLLKIPYIPILHGGRLGDRLKTSSKLCERLFGCATVNVAPSDYMKQLFSEAGFNNINTIPNVLSIEDYAFNLSESDQINLLWVRRFHPMYNPLMAVKVLKLLNDYKHNACLTMVGDTEDSSFEVVTRYSEKYNLKVSFTGSLTKEAWRRLAVSHSIFINTSTVDNMPISVIEAMALGLPVLSTNVGGLPFLIRHGVDGLLVPSDDIEAMVAQIIELSKHPDWYKTMAKTGRQRAESFSWEAVKPLWSRILK